MSKIERKNLLYAVILAVLGSIFMYISVGYSNTLGGIPFIYNLEYLTQDNLYQQPLEPNKNIFVIGIDDDTLREYGPWNSWTRSTMAELINKLNSSSQYKPAVIGIDVMYFGETDQEEDLALVEAAESSGNVVVASNIIFSREVVEEAESRFYIKNNIVDVEYPYETLREVTKQGYINMLADKDGIVRRSIQSVNYNSNTANSFAYEIYKEYIRAMGEQEKKIPYLNEDKMCYIPFSTKPGEYYSNTSMLKVLNGEVPLEMFKDSIVLIGPYAEGMLDNYFTPIDRSKAMYGVEVHANIIQGLLEGNYKSMVSMSLQVILLAAIILIYYLLLLVMESKWSGLLVIITVIAYPLLSKIIYDKGYIMYVIYIPIAVLILYGYRLIYNYTVETVRRKTIIRTFKKYVAPQVVDELVKSKNSIPQLGGIKKHIAVLFIDIRGFTTISENMEPEEVVEMLNENLKIISEVIYKNGGTLDKFIGDAAMAIFNAPFEQEDYVFKAVNTAIEIITESNNRKTYFEVKYGKHINYGIGINSGEAVIGNIGSEVRLDYTAIGDTVNCASRLEGKARENEILISEDVYNRIKDRIVADNLGKIKLKGKQKEISIFSVKKTL